jgi:hypothetical protein
MKKKMKGGGGTGTNAANHQKPENHSKHEGENQIELDDKRMESHDKRTATESMRSTETQLKSWLETKVSAEFTNVLDVGEKPPSSGVKCGALEARTPPVSTELFPKSDIAEGARQEKELGNSAAVKITDTKKAGDKSEFSEKPRQPKSPGLLLKREDQSNSEKARLIEGKIFDGSQNSEPPNKPVTDDDQWETVGARPRDRRKKGAASMKATSQQHGANSADTHGQQMGIKKKSGSRKEARRRLKNRKIANEILNSVLDKVEESVKRRSHSSDNLGNEIAAKRTNPLLMSSQAQMSPPTQARASSIRDILTSGNETIPKQPTHTTLTMTYSERTRDTSKDTPAQGNSNEQKQGVNPNTFKVVSAPADQNTVPTIPETLSTAPIDKKPLGTDSSSGDSLEAQKSRTPTACSVKDFSPSPPLPTLLSPGNNNSSSSSVASSLDAPHGNLPDPTENEVGYHLLGVCKRLSNEIGLFMKRRNDALSIRRHERRLVLAALEETLGAIWPDVCKVEMYGSCATNLDLPSSDLDVVVCGLDRPVELVHSPSNAALSMSSTTARANAANNDDGTRDDENTGRGRSQHEITPFNSELQHFSQRQMHHTMHMMYPQMSPNADRVMRLAVELEHQPWAVHVKAIPTATVPVIKILADPARLSGSVGSNNDWLVQHSMASQSVTESSDSQSNSQSTITHYQNGQSPPLWRGADVVNGLLKVDITFEGPEHGGIGSTKFSLQAVEEFAAETGLKPEATSAVQVLMVLKELLAQRRLNEPFSGGLSSYALLLLVISVIKERSIIREELEKAERQRRLVAAGGGNSALRSPEKSKKVKDPSPKPESIRSRNDQKAAHPGDRNKVRPSMPAVLKPKDTSISLKEVSKYAMSHKSKADLKIVDPQSEGVKSHTARGQSSWASIARQSSSTGSLHEQHTPDQPKDSVSSEKSNSPQKSNNKDLKKPSSFADAVANGVATQEMRQFVSPEDSIGKVVQEKSNARKEGNKMDEKVARAAALSEERKNDSTVQAGQQNAAANQGTGQDTENSSSSNRAATFLNQGDRMGPDSSVFPQGFHDVVEVLCSGETTSGKLLMHFLLFYGQHFDSHTTAIDFSGTHQRDAIVNQGYSVRSPYMQRSSAGSYDPVTGMLMVDPIVVYDPLEGAENNNVARSCFAWSNIRWLFAQSYMTLSSTVETNATQGKGNRSSQSSGDGPAYGHDQSGNVVVDPNSPLLELLLSY